MALIYRIYTEKKNKLAIVRLAAQAFESFTTQPTLGYYRGKAEPSIVIEVVRAREQAIRALAKSIRAMNGQKSVLVIKVSGEAKTVRN